MGGTTNFWDFVYCILTIAFVVLLLAGLEKLNKILKIEFINLMLKALFVGERVMIMCVFVIVIFMLISMNNIVSAAYLSICGIVLLIVATYEYKNNISNKQSLLGKIFAASVLVGLPVIHIISTL